MSSDAPTNASDLSITDCMDDPEVTLADVIDFVGDTLRTLCDAQGIELKDVDHELIDSLPSKAFDEHLSGGAGR
ncbi:hypothetical protein [Paraburkholderia aromaticivorans]|uniref:hypothetical protein n=1 Tax=Paraburkholderia aromaticivorans TaxID=2026199 RepID=UPI0012FDF712|nr:hypothetical protein [Paraburkholderia aromaticivorans]